MVTRRGKLSAVSRRAQLIFMLLVSGLLHVALFVALSGSEPNDRQRRVEPRAVEMEVVYQDVTPPPEPPAPEPRQPPPDEAPPRLPPKKEDPPRHAERPRPTTTKAPDTSEAPPSDAAPAGPSEPPPALAQDVPRDVPHPQQRPNLEPQGLLGGGMLRGGPPSTGRTLRPGEGPDPKALAVRQAEEARVRVDGWAQDAAATARASSGATHPYFAKLREGFAKQLVNPPPPDLKVLGSRMKREQVDAIARFGKTGSPIVAEPRDHRLEQRNRMQAAVEAGRAANMYMVDVTTPVLALAAIVEVWQARDGKLLDLKVLEGSGDPKFDSWAVSQLRDALASAEAPKPGGGLGIRDDGMRSRWRLEEYLGNPRVQIHLIGVY
ncbi:MULTISPECIES: ferrichrome ABC transporter substrate-binding protein [unclassified Myxococcus]|uniref:ferrichrome ABC transporter substrate-binding protein n=1 Tax=Myxococcus TaxID=32 RepID=UPI001143E4EE|nr:MULTISPECIES: ferrichrome ABC transporter substrate-binding protein [unclassified Myxococcus]NOK01935.1 ferrichrome ABC transporter substrate-binding protein [Myxococcus xanthus]